MGWLTGYCFDVELLFSHSTSVFSDTTSVERRSESIPEGACKSSPMHRISPAASAAQQPFHSRNGSSCEAVQRRTTTYNIQHTYNATCMHAHKIPRYTRGGQVDFEAWR